MGLATASVTLERFCDELSRQSGYKVVFLAPTLGERTAPNSHQTAFVKTIRTRNSSPTIRANWIEIFLEIAFRSRHEGNFFW